MFDVERKREIEQALKALTGTPFGAGALKLLGVLGYKSNRRLKARSSSPKDFLALFEQSKELDAKQALHEQWQSAEFLFQLTGDEVHDTRQVTMQFEGVGKWEKSRIESYVFLAIELKPGHYTRTNLASITRALNRLFEMPAMILFKLDGTLTLSVIDRRLHKREPSKDVLEKVTLIKDIRLANPHRAHIEILYDLHLDELRSRHEFTSFDGLHDAWRKTLDTSALNKRFYKEIANWYFWALRHIRFPSGAPKESDGKDHVSVIRLITRLIFCWFIREKGLIPDSLFDRKTLDRVLTGFAPDSCKDKNSVYYRAVLQNLFFATLDTEMDKRDWATEGQHFMAHSLYRFRESFREPDKALDLFKTIPFLNGGLFECLDKSVGTKEKPRYVRADGFSRRPDSQPTVPDFLFFGDEETVDLSEDYGDAKFKRADVRGLFRTFEHYKFTVAENTPIEEEVALDPELSGQVFENLLAAYNPETGATARKQTGSFFTPREIVSYMADEALIACLTTKLEAAIPEAKEVEARLRHLFSYTAEEHKFSKSETEVLIAAIDSLKVLDPAVGSGAFPMGILHKLVYVLGKLDPHNEQWKERQVARVRDAMVAVEKVEDSTIRERTLCEMEQQIAGVNEAFERNELDYGRKLYLIENCIYGVDIQPIAVQIAKMRFFISLIVDQKLDDMAPNRGIRPLPNLETKFVAANTLVGIERPKKSSQDTLRNPEIGRLEKELSAVRRDHFTARSLRTKRRLRDRDKALRDEIATLLKADGWYDKTAKMLAAWDPYDQNAHADFFDLEWMFGIIGGVDIVIGNPPYVLLQGANRDASLIVLFRERYKVASYKLDLYHLFIERGVSLLDQHGTISYITPSNFVSNNYTEPLRRFLLTETSLAKLVFFDEGVFDASVHNLVFVARKGVRGDSATAFLKAVVDGGTMVVEEKSKVLQNRLVDDMCLLVPRLTEAAGNVVARMDRVGVTLGDLASVNFGMQLRDRTKYPTDVVESPRGGSVLSKHHRRCYTGKDVHRYLVTLSDRWCNFNRIAQRGGCWDERIHKAKGKILVRQVGNFPEGGLDTRGYAVLNTAFMIYPKTGASDSRFLLGVLNSSAIRFYWLNRFQDDRRTFPKIKGEYLKMLPFPTGDSDSQLQLVGLVDRIVAAKQESQRVDTKDLESKIDEIVFHLYGLTEDEIAIVEGRPK